jgi:hypothetical protein
LYGVGSGLWGAVDLTAADRRRAANARKAGGGRGVEGAMHAALLALVALALAPAPATTIRVREPSWPMARGSGEASRAAVPADRPIVRVASDRPNRPIIVPVAGWPSAQPQPGDAPVVRPMILIGEARGEPRAGVFVAPRPLSCPAGTEQAERLPEDRASGYEQWCAHPDGRRHGPFAAWDEHGRISIRGQYANGSEAGTWEHWHPSGERRSLHHYVDGKPEGVWRDWHTNGRLEQEMHYIAGKRHGMTTRWYANGQVFTETRYVHDEVADGEHTFYYEKGGPIERGQFVDHRREGVWTIYAPDGAVLETRRWHRGEQVP